MTETWYNGLNAVLKRLAPETARRRSAGAEMPVSFSHRRLKRLNWNLFLCGRGR